MNAPTPKKLPGFIEIYGTILAHTEKAIRVRIDTVNGQELDSLQKTYWLPISQTDSHWESHVEGEDWILISNWLARKMGFV